MVAIRRRRKILSTHNNAAPGKPLTTPMTRILLLISVLALIGAVFACTSPKTGANSSPTEAYKALFAAVKAKDIEGIKRNITKKTIDLGKMSMDRFKKSEKEAYENGFTATTFSESLPSIRDERIKDNMGAIEVWNSKESTWDDLPFILEDGSWKLAMGDAFAGSFQSPGKGRNQIEKEAANAVSGGPVMLGSNTNTNSASNRSTSGPTADRNAK